MGCDTLRVGASLDRMGIPPQATTVTMPPQEICLLAGKRGEAQAAFSAYLARYHAGPYASAARSYLRKIATLPSEQKP